MTKSTLRFLAAGPVLASGALCFVGCSEAGPSSEPIESDAGPVTGGVTMGPTTASVSSVTNTASATTSVATTSSTTGGANTTGMSMGPTTGSMGTTGSGTTGALGGTNSVTNAASTSNSTTGGTTTGAGGMGGMGGNGSTEDTSTETTGTTGGDDLNSGENTMGWIGCSMGENVATGYKRIGGTRMWGPYGNGGAVVQSWTNSNGADWGRFDNQVAMHGMPEAVWIMICIFPSGATIQEIRQLVANTREHAPGAYIYITGQPLYVEGATCSLAGGEGGPESTDELAQQMAAEDLEVHYAGTFGPLGPGTVLASDSTGCHASSEGEDLLGEQAKMKFGQP